MFRFISACLAALGAFVVGAALSGSPPIAIGASIMAFFVTNGLGD